MKDTDNTGLFAIYLIPEGRWITLWDFFRRNYLFLEDAIPVFHNSQAAADARQGLPELLASHCIIVPIITNPPKVPTE